MMDSLDLQILTSLDADARRSFADLARELDVSQPTIADRVRRMEERGILRGSMLSLDHTRIGYGIGAFVRIRTNGSARALIEEARTLPQVIELTNVTGEDGMIARVAARSVEDLSTVLDRLSAFGQTSTSVVLNTPIPFRNPIGLPALAPDDREVTPPTPIGERVERRDPTRRGRVTAKK
ncbi:MAG: Lrp/AsnC family transcriptional regulator [Gammaproteobacteria bacterium]